MKDNVYKLQLLDNKVDVNEEIETKEQPKVTPRVSNPIYKNMLNFHNSKIGDKLTIKDLLG